MKKLSILKGLAWLTDKIGFIKKCGDTIAASLQALELFTGECKKIWNIKDETENNQSIELGIPTDTTNNAINHEESDKTTEGDS